MSDHQEHRQHHAGEDQAQPRRRIPFTHYESWIDRQIRQAQERGDFDNLPGHGRPLADDDPNLALAGDDALGLRLLKSNEALPAWVELNKEIAGERAACRRILAAYTAERDPEHRARLAADYRKRVRELNDKIQTYNFIVPARQLEQVTLQPEHDLREADFTRWRAHDEA